LTAELHKAAACFGLWANGTLAAFAGVLHKPHAIAKNIKGISRCVTLPDWQGLGLAFVLMETIGQAYKATGFRTRAYPAHPQFVRSFKKDKWRCDYKPGKPQAYKQFRGSSKGGGQRPCAVFEYIGPAMELHDAEKLLARAGV